MSTILRARIRKIHKTFDFYWWEDVLNDFEDKTESAKNCNYFLRENRSIILILIDWIDIDLIGILRWSHENLVL